MNRPRLLLIAGAFALPLYAAAAQEPAMPPVDGEPACHGPAVLPPELAGWGAERRSVTAAKDTELSDAPVLPVGRAVEATLFPTPEISYPVRPEKPGGSVSNGGLFLFDVAEAGRYRVSLASAAWIDVVEGGVAQVSVAHGRGSACSPIRKMVDYDLKAGRHLLQISANSGDALTLMVSKLP